MKKVVIFVTFVVLTFLTFIESALAEVLFETPDYQVHQTVTQGDYTYYVAIHKVTRQVVIIPSAELQLQNMSHSSQNQGGFYKVSDLPVGPKPGEGIVIELPPVDKDGDLEDFGPAGDDNIGPLPIF